MILWHLGGILLLPSRTQVRNPSAFVCTAAGKATQRVPGQEELRCALERLRVEGVVDENANSILTKGIVPLEKACGSVSAKIQSKST
jgi:hypothetical protein